MMKKKHERVVLAEEFLAQLLQPFFPIKTISEIHINKDGRIVIVYGKEVTEYTS
jgi:hypothetical protein